jgi:hypothetical protein
VYSFFQRRVLTYNEGMLPETSNIKIIDHLTKWALAFSGYFLSRSDAVFSFLFWICCFSCLEFDFLGRWEEIV